MSHSFILAFFVLIELTQAIISLNPYAPHIVRCPSGLLTRPASGTLCSQESNWVKNRQAVTKQKLANFLAGANLTDFDALSFLTNTSRSINIGLAFSGGGYRAMLAGAGQLSALDERTASSDSGLKGLLQASTYISGLSGGSWLVGSIALNDYVSVDDILAQGKLWDLEKSIFNNFGLDPISAAAYYASISAEVEAKQLAGYKVTVTDPWARALSYQLLSNSPENGAGLTWSSISSLSNLKNYQMPFPILVADGRAPGTQIIDANSTIFEFTPFEMGSWDPSLSQFVQTQYIGSYLNNGKSMTGTCVNGFDNAGFVMGTSSSLFNAFILQIDTVGLPSFLSSLIKLFLLPASIINVDIAYYAPNPFYSSGGSGLLGNLGNLVGSVVGRIIGSNTLYLVDGGEDGQNVPLEPLLQPQRQVDVIFAHDNGADIGGWPSGQSLVETYERQFSSQGGGVAFPYVPDSTTFRNLNLTAKPTFFGCDARNLNALSLNPLDIPLVIYIANRPFSYWSNTSTFRLTYAEDEKRGMIRNGFETETRFNGTIDPEWPACVGCAIIRREQERQGVEQTEQCKKCFAKYCWNGDYYSGPDIGDNFSNDGLTTSSEYYNANNVEGINNGGITLFKRDVEEQEEEE